MQEPGEEEDEKEAEHYRMPWKIAAKSTMMERRDKKRGKGARGALAKLGNRCSIPTPMGFHSKADIDKASPDVSLWYPIDPDPILRVTRCVPQNGSSIRARGGGWCPSAWDFWPWIQLLVNHVPLVSGLFHFRDFRGII